MKCLITGCGGFIGSHLAEYLLDQGMTVYGTVYRDQRNLAHLKDRIVILRCDILDKERVQSIVAEIRPDYIFHLAAQSLPRVSWQEPEQAFKVNVLGTLYLLEGVRQAGLHSLIEVMGSSADYRATREGEGPIREDHLLEPSSPYALSKIAQDHLALLYHRAYSMRIVRVRPFFVIGPRKTGDVCSDFARGIVEIEKGQRGVLEVGNLDAVRDFLDVRDAVAALWVVAEKGEVGEVYNVCSGRGYRIRNVLEQLISLSPTKIEVCQDLHQMRPLDEPVKIGDNSKVQQLGWQPKLPIEQTLAEILAFWRVEA